MGRVLTGGCFTTTSFCDLEGRFVTGDFFATISCVIWGTICGDLEGHFVY